MDMQAGVHDRADRRMPGRIKFLSQGQGTRVGSL
jgi:hypothetical protein